MPSVRTAVWSCMRPGRNAPAQGAALLAGDDGGLLGVLLLLARDERAAARFPGTGASDLHFCAVQADSDAAGGGVGEHVGQGAQPDAGLAGHGEPAGGQQRPHLADRTADGGPADPVHHGQSLVRELEPQVNEGDDDPVGERQVMARPGAGRAKPLVAPACEQPVLLSSRPRSGHLLDEPG